MAGTRKPPGDPIEERLDEIARLLAVLVGRDKTLQDRVADLSAAGFGPTRISELTGTSAAYANVAIKRAKEKKTKKAEG
jgi:hypothetical protein